MTPTNTQEQILEAAMQVIVRDGLDGTSMRAVAEEADVSVGLLSYHFDDKDNLIVAAFERSCAHLLEFTDQQMAATATDPAAQLDAVIRSFFDGDFVTDDYLATWFAIWAVARTNAAVAAAERQLYDDYGHRIERAIAAVSPQLSRSELARRATDVVVIQNGLWLNWARFHDLDDLERGLKLCQAVANGALT